MKAGEVEHYCNDLDERRTGLNRGRGSSVVAARQELLMGYGQNRERGVKIRSRISGWSTGIELLYTEMRRIRGQQFGRDRLGQIVTCECELPGVKCLMMIITIPNTYLLWQAVLYTLLIFTYLIFTTITCWYQYYPFFIIGETEVWNS